MSWDLQVKSVRKKAYFSLNRIVQINNFLDSDTKKLLINALVMPHLNYCCSSWNNMSSSNLRKVESLMRSINKVHKMNKSFDQIRKYNTLTMTFKGINKITPTYLSKKFSLVRQNHNRVTRSAVHNNLTTPLATNNFKSRTFICSATPFWNNLPTQLKTTNSLLTFKTLLQRHIFQ